MKKKEQISPATDLKATVRKIRDTRFVLNRVRLMHGLSAAMVILMVFTIALSVNGQTKAMAERAPLTSDPISEQTASADLAMAGNAGETLALELLDMPELDEFAAFGRSGDSLDLVPEEVPATVAAAVPEVPAEPVTLYVKSNGVNVREQPTTASAILSQVSTGDKVSRIAIASEWSQVTLDAGKTGYILSSFLSEAVVNKPTPTPTSTPTPKPTAKPTPKPTPKPATTAAPVATKAGSSLTDDQRQAIIELAKAQIGKRYVFGAMSPSVGFDCSGLTAYIYKSLFNIYLPHSARDQAKMGVAVAKSSIQVGDIICFDWDSPRGVVDHVGIYIGGGQYIHAASSRGRVVQSTINIATNPITTIRRIIH